MPSALDVRDLVKDYPQPRGWRDVLRSPLRRPRRRALDGLTLTVRAGERLALVGPNGAGKSTLARIATGVVLPDGGRVQVAGEPVGPGGRWRAEVGFARPDDPALHPRLNALECLRFHAALYGAPAETEGLRSALARVEAEDLATRRVATLSSGEKARISLAKALLHRPRLLILDELSRVLDPGAAKRSRELLVEYAREGGAVLLITHDLSEAALGDRVALLQAGKVTAAGAWGEVEPTAREAFAL